MEDEAVEYIPIILGKKYGGEYDDHTLALGIQVGSVFTALADVNLQEYSTYVYPDVVAQCDLIAMNEGFVQTVSPCPVDDELVTLTFTRNDEEKLNG